MAQYNIPLEESEGDLSEGAQAQSSQAGVGESVVGLEQPHTTQQDTSSNLLTGREHEDVSDGDAEIIEEEDVPGVEDEEEGKSQFHAGSHVRQQQMSSFQSESRPVVVHEPPLPPMDSKAFSPSLMLEKTLAAHDPPLSAYNAALTSGADAAEEEAEECTDEIVAIAPVSVAGSDSDSLQLVAHVNLDGGIERTQHDVKEQMNMSAINGLEEEVEEEEEEVIQGKEREEMFLVVGSPVELEAESADHPSMEDQLEDQLEDHVSSKQPEISDGGDDEGPVDDREQEDQGVEEELGDDDYSFDIEASSLG